MRRLLPFIIGIIVLLAFALAIPFLLQVDNHRSQLADLLSQALGRKVVIGKLDSSLFPPTLGIHELAVMDASGATPALQVERIDARVSLGSLVTFKIVPQTLTFTHWLLNIHRRSDGSWDSDEWTTAVSHLPGGTGNGPTSIVTHQGEVHWIDSFATGNPELVLQGIEATNDRENENATASATLIGLSTPLSLKLDAKGHFLTSPEWSGDLHLSDADRTLAVHLTDKNDFLTAEGDALQWRADTVVRLIQFYTRWTQTSVPAGSPAMLQNWKVQFTSSGSTTTFQHDGQLAGGTVSAQGSSWAMGGTLHIHVAATLGNVPFPSLGELVGFSAPADGLLSAHVQYNMLISSQPWDQFSGAGDVDIAQGHYRLPDVSVQKLAHVHTFAYIKAKFGNVADDGIPFRSIHLRWLAMNGKVTFNDGLFDGGDIRGALTGSFDPVRRGVDAYARVAIHETNAKLLAKIPGHYLIGSTGHEQVQPIYGHVQGNWDEWSLRSLPSSKIPAAIRNNLQKTIKG